MLSVDPSRNVLFSRAEQYDPDVADIGRRRDLRVRSEPGKVSLSGKNSGSWSSLPALGSLARIYRARPAGTDSDRPATYAVKMLRREWQDDPHAIWLLQREALVGQEVSHPHLVPVLAATVLEPPRLLVMPWLEGASLQTRLAAGEQFDVPTALWIARQTAEALEALNAAGWMHGDVSPGNIHVSSAGHVTLLDLSFARRADETGSAVDRPIMGTARYLAPEYFTSSLRADIRSDIYSIGAGAVRGSFPAARLS